MAGFQVIIYGRFVGDHRGFEHPISFSLLALIFIPFFWYTTAIMVSRLREVSDKPQPSVFATKPPAPPDNLLGPIPTYKPEANPKSISELASSHSSNKTHSPIPIPGKQEPSSPGRGVSIGGGITAGSCSNVQVGGNSNQAQTNCGPVERHVTEAQKTAIISALSEKHVRVTFGAIINVPDAQQFAFELCSAFKSAGVPTNCDITPMMSHGTPWVGFKVAYRGPEAREGEMVDTPHDSPAGIVLNALVSAANLKRGVVDREPNFEDGLVLVTIGSPPPP